MSTVSGKNNKSTAAHRIQQDNKEKKTCRYLSSYKNGKPNDHLNFLLAWLFGLRQMKGTTSVSKRLISNIAPLRPVSCTSAPVLLFCVDLLQAPVPSTVYAALPSSAASSVSPFASWNF